MSDHPLDGIRVVEIATGEAAALACRVMAGYGADVIKIEPPEGDPSRRLGPFPSGHVAPDTGAAFHYFHTGKRSVVLDLGLAGGRQLLATLLDHVQLLVTDVLAQDREAAGIARGRLREEHPDLSIVSVTPYGEGGPYARWAATELTEFAVGGQMSLMGDPGREPLKAFHNQAECQTSFHVLGAAMVAILAAARSGAGQYVEISVQEVQASALEAQGPMAFNDDPMPGGVLRMGNGFRGTWGLYPCKDGYVGVFDAASARPVFEAIGHPEWYERRNDMEFMRDECKSAFEEWFAQRTRAEVYEAAIAYGAAFSYVAEPADLLASPIVSRTGIWRTVPHPVTGFVQVPGPPFGSEAMAFELTPAPALGEHTDGVLQELAGAAPRDVGLARGQSAYSERHGVTAGQGAPVSA